MTDKNNEKTIKPHNNSVLPNSNKSKSTNKKFSDRGKVTTTQTVLSPKKPDGDNS